MFLLNFIAAVFISSAYAQTTVNPDIPNPEILTQKYLDEISEAKIGQTRFARKSVSYRAMPSSRASQSAPSGAGDRQIQEADVFKLGKTGQKELFLLNHYRGFQIVSFEDGLERPRIEGRFPIFNNYSSEMYYIEAQNKVLIVNTEWSYTKNYWQSNHMTKVYLMDVADSSAPKLVKEISVPGYLSESRLVGDVLYTVTSSGNWNDQKAQISSVKISEKDVELIEQVELHGNNKWVRTMNVVKEGEKYFVISTLSGSSAGDSINVHDITSPKGDVKKLLTAKARGTISERSNTFIHKNHLFAVSNYQTSVNSVTRISVEAFPMTESSVEVVSKESMRVSVGDTNGLHASLQDVRVSGDLLYAFWVPANNIDPFELFDISAPGQGIKHLGQLQFDGWVSKSFPIEFNDKKYVLGLGEIVPMTSESGKRYPQAKIFEVKKINDVYKHEVVASLTIDSDEVWSNLNTEDKYFEMVQEAPGVYNVLFPVTFKKNWKSGAKVVSVDLNTGSLTEGASVTGEEGWLKRVFLNKELHSLNAFSDETLESFKQEDMSGKGFAKSVSVLELARDIVDFHILNSTEGLQIINKAKRVELRKVLLSDADTEKQNVLSSISIKGKYEWHKIRDGKMYLVTSFTKKETRSYGNDQSDSYEYDVFDYANLNVVDLATQSESVERIAITKQTDEYRYYYYFQIQAITSENTEILKINNEFFKIMGHSMKKLNVAESCQYFFDTKSDSFSMEAVGSDIYAFTTFKVKPVDAKEDLNYEYELPFTKKLAFEGNNVACSVSINVPGRPVMTREGQLVTNEFKSQYYYYPRGIHYDYVGGGRYMPGFSQSSKTFSLKFTSAEEVTLVDILDYDITNGLFKDGFITYDADESRLNLWRVTTDGEFLVKPQYLNLGEDSSLITVKSFNGRSFIFMKHEQKVDLFEIAKTQRVSRLKVTSSFDQDLQDGSAEYIFAIQNIVPDQDLSRFHISQGMYGMTDLILQ